MRRILLLSALLALPLADARAAAARSGALYPAASAAWTGAIGSGLTTPDGAAIPLAPVIAQLETGLKIDHDAYANLPAHERKAALELAVDAAQAELTQKAYELSSQARALAAPDRTLDKEGRAELYHVVAQLDEMRANYGPLVGESEREAVASAYGQAAARAWHIRNELLGRVEGMGAALSGAGRDEPAAAPPPQGSHHAVKLLARMRATKFGWGVDDIDALLTGFGFERRNGGKHRVYVHPEYRQLRRTVKHQRDLPPAAVQDAVDVILELGRLRDAAAAPRAAAAPEDLPADFKLDDLAVLAEHGEKKTARDLARLAPADPRREPQPKAEPPTP